MEEGKKLDTPLSASSVEDRRMVICRGREGISDSDSNSSSDESCLPSKYGEDYDDDSSCSRNSQGPVHVSSDEGQRKGPSSSGGIRQFCKLCGYMKRGHICAVADGQLAGRNHPGEAPAPVVDQEGVLQFEDELPKKVRDIIKNFSSPDDPICLFNIFNRINQNNIDNGVLRKRRNLKPILKTIGDMLSSGEIIHISTSMDRPGMENGFFSMNPGYVFDESLARKNINIVKDFNHSGFNFGRRRLVEQFDKLTGTILRRYRCMSDACSTMGLPRHYLSYKVFGGGAKSHTCVFGWRELNLNEPEISDTVGNPVESYADDNMLRVYMKRYLGKTPDEILPWTTFAETFDKSAFVDNDYDQRSIGLKIKRPSKEKKLISDNQEMGIFSENGQRKKIKGERKLEALNYLQYTLSKNFDLSLPLQENFAHRAPFVCSKSKRKATGEPLPNKRVKSVGSGSGPKVTEQYDKETGKVLRRYRCMAEACHAMGQAHHYLSYKVFGTGSRFHSCVFGWRELNKDDTEDTLTDQYADVAALRSYMEQYIDKDPKDIPTWSDFVSSHVPDTAIDVADISGGVKLSTNGNFGRRVVEQYDRATNKVLRRYFSMTDASIALGQPAHYLAYKVFGKGARSHTCLFGWRDLPPGTSVDPQDGESYADPNHLLLYMMKYIDKPPHLVIGWTEFEEKFNALFPEGSYQKMLPMTGTAANQTKTSYSKSKSKGPVKDEQYIIEQYDIDTNTILHRYNSEEEACNAMGRSGDYLYKAAFRNGGESKCVFGWRKIQKHDCAAVEPKQGEAYADTEALKSYLEIYIKKAKNRRLSWEEFRNRSSGVFKGFSSQHDNTVDLKVFSDDLENQTSIESDGFRLHKRRKKEMIGVPANNKVMEQRDLLTNAVLRRYVSMNDACTAMGQPLHYLTYKVFGRGSKTYNCVFKWNALQGVQSIEPNVGEEYESIAALRAYMSAFVCQPKEEVPSWTEFKSTYVAKENTTAGSASTEEKISCGLAGNRKLIMTAVQNVSHTGIDATNAVLEMEVKKLQNDCEAYVNIIEELRELVKDGLIIERKVCALKNGPQLAYQINEHYHLDCSDIQVLCLTVSCNQSLKLFANAREAAVDLDIDEENIKKVCRRLITSYSNLCFRWFNESESRYPPIEVEYSIMDIKSICAAQENTISKNLQKSKIFTILRRNRFPSELQSFIGRRFSKPDSDDFLEVFIITHVCRQLLSEADDFYFRCYSKTAHQSKRPTEEKDFQYLSVDTVISQRAKISWVRAGAHASLLTEGKSTAVDLSKEQRRGRGRPRKFAKSEVSDDDTICSIDSDTRKCKEDLILAAERRVMSTIEGLCNKNISCNLSNIEIAIPDELLHMWGEHNLSVSEIISKLATKGAVNVNKDKISINEHFHMEHNDIPVLCLTADCITPLRLFRNVRDISLELGINVDTVLRVCRRLQKTTRNVCFRWMDQNSDEYPKLKVPVSIESLRLDYVEKKQGICAGGTVVPRRHARARSLALDAEIYEQISQSRKKFVSVQRRNISLMVLKMLGRKFKIPGSDDVFITSDVCCKNGHASLFYKYYSLRKFPKSKPNLVSSYDFAECESMLHSKQFADWLPKDFNNNQSKIDSSTSSSETSTISDEETDVSSEEEYKSLPGSSTIKIKSSKVRHLAVISNLVLDLLKKWKPGEPPVSYKDIKSHLWESGIRDVQSSSREVAVAIRRLIQVGRLLHEVNGVSVKHASIGDIQSNENGTFRPNERYYDEELAVPVHCETIGNTFVKLFPSVACASDYLLLEEKDIRSCCIGRVNQLGGLRFRWATDDEICDVDLNRMKHASNSDYLNVSETKWMIGDRLKRRVTEVVRDLTGAAAHITVDTVYVHLIGDFEGKGVLPAYVEDILNIQVRKGYILLDEARMSNREDDESLYIINPQYRPDHSVAPILCLSIDNEPLRVFSTIKEAERILEIESIAILNVILRVKSKSTRNLKFIWLDEATQHELEFARDHTNDVQDYIKPLGAGRSAEYAEEFSERRKTKRLKQFTSQLSQAYHVPSSISEVYKGHNVLDSRVKRTLATSMSISDDHRPEKVALIAKPGRSRGRPRKYVQNLSDSDESKEEHVLGFEAYCERHNTKGNAIDAFIPDHFGNEKHGIDMFERNDDFLVFTGEMIGSSSQINIFLANAKCLLYPAGKILKARVTQDSSGVGIIEAFVACSLGPVMKDQDDLLDNAVNALNVFDGEAVRSVAYEDCYLEHEDLLLEIYWKAMSSLKGPEMDKIEAGDVREFLEYALNLVKIFGDQEMSKQWSYGEIMELVRILKLNSGKLDLSGKNWRLSSLNAAREKKEIAAVYYSLFCPLNRTQSYRKICNIFSCAEFMKGHDCIVDTFDWLSQNKLLVLIKESMSSDSLATEKLSYVMNEEYDAINTDYANFSDSPLSLKLEDVPPMLLNCGAEKED